MEKIKLGDLCTPSQGQIKEKPDVIIDYIDISSVDNETKKVTGYQTMTFSESPSRARKAVKKGSILVSTVRPNLNAVAILEKDTPNLSIASTGFCILDCKEDTDERFVFNYCKSKVFIDDMVSQATGASYPAVSDKIVRSVLVPAYSYEEQKHIGEVLDKISDVIEKRRAELRDLDNLIKARFVEMFGERGKVLPLTSYVWFQEGPGVRSVDFTPEGTNLLTGSNINNNELSFGYKSDRFISDELANGKYAHFMCDKDDILVVSSAIAPEKFDKKVIIVEEDKKYCLNTGIIRFKPNREVMTLGYFREFLKTDYFKHQVMAEMRGIAQMHFGPSHLKQMTILLPESMEQQIEFEKFVTQVDKSKVAVQKALEDTQTLFDSLMQEYFG